MSKERTPEEKRIIEIKGEIIGLHRQIEKLQIEKWILEGYPPIPVLVSYDNGTENITEEVLYTKDHYEGNPDFWLSPKLPGQWEYGQELKGKINP